MDQYLGFPPELPIGTHHNFQEVKRVGKSITGNGLDIKDDAARMFLWRESLIIEEVLIMAQQDAVALPRIAVVVGIIPLEEAYFPGGRDIETEIAQNLDQHRLDVLIRVELRDPPEPPVKGPQFRPGEVL